MRFTMISAACLAVAGSAFAANEKSDARVTIVGKLACAHCDGGIGDSCASAIKAGDSLFVVQGDAGKELFDARHKKEVRSVSGVLSVKDGHFYLDGKKAGEAKKAKEGAVVVGTVHKDGDKYYLGAGDSKITVSGKAVDSLSSMVNQRVKLSGALALKDNAVTLDASKAELAPKKPKK